MRVIHFKLVLTFSLGMLVGCSGITAKKPSSVWDQRRDSKSVEAPSAEAYKQELAELDHDGGNVELNYQAEQVESFAAENADEFSTEADEVSASVEEKIMAAPLSSYTVQVFASVDIDRVYKFAEQNQISVQYIVPTARDDIIWYVLFLDIYADIDSAKAALKEIAASVKTQPWIRNIGSVQKLILQ